MKTMTFKITVEIRDGVKGRKSDNVRVKPDGVGYGNPSAAECGVAISLSNKRRA